MARTIGIAAENTGQHAALGPRLADLCNFPAARRHRVDLRGVAASLADVNAVLEIEMSQQLRPDAVRAQVGFDDPESLKRMLPLARQSADRVCDPGSSVSMVKFASDDVAVHFQVFPGCGLNLAPDAATKGEPLYNAKEKHRRPLFCSTYAQLGDKLYDSLSGH